MRKMNYCKNKLNSYFPKTMSNLLQDDSLSLSLSIYIYIYISIF